MISLKPIFLMYDNGVDQLERKAADEAVKKAAKIFQNRPAFTLGNLVKVDGYEIPIDSLVQNSPILRQTAYGNQIDVDGVHSAVFNSKLHKNSPFIGVVLTSKDLTAKFGRNYLNFCFGYTFGDVTIQSVARFRDMSDKNRETMIEGVILHELGHVFNLAGDRSRSHTEYNLGMHCTNLGCVMNQGLTREAMLEHFRMAKKMGRIYCPQCMLEASSN